VPKKFKKQLFQIKSKVEELIQVKMFRNRDRGLSSSTLYWFFKVWNRAKWKIIALFWSYRCKQIANTSNSGFRFIQTGNRHAYNVPELLLVSETSTTLRLFQ